MSRNVKQFIPAGLRWFVWERDNFTCRYCGRRQFLSLDHVVPESAGGPTQADNLITACQPCNRRKGTLDLDVFKDASRGVNERNAGVFAKLPRSFPVVQRDRNGLPRQTDSGATEYRMVDWHNMTRQQFMCIIAELRAEQAHLEYQTTIFEIVASVWDRFPAAHTARQALSEAAS